MEKQKDVFELDMFDTTTEVRIKYGSYNHNGTLALMMLCRPDEYEEGYYSQFGRSAEGPYVSPYGVATVNLQESDMLPVDEQFVDENNMPGIGKWLQENGIAQPTGKLACSGFCCYEAYRFNAPKEELQKIEAARLEISGKNGESRSAAPKLR